MPTDLEFTGERFVPGVPGEIEFEHVHRYAFARTLVAGRRVLDAACGEGYGSALLADVAASVAGVDIDAATLAHARTEYGARANLAFHEASAAALPFADASFDTIVSFETIEHLPASDQPRMLAEFARVLAPGGLLVLSAPNRVEYSEVRDYANPFHQHEHDRAELDALLATHFAVRRFYHQRVWLGSALWSEEGGAHCAALAGDSAAVQPAALPPAMYYVVLAARAATDLPADVPAVSLFTDPDGGELARLQAQGTEIARLDRLLGERTAALDRASTQVVHLEALVAYRDGVVVQRDAQLVALNAAIDAEREQAVRAAQAADAAAAGYALTLAATRAAVTAGVATAAAMAAANDRLQAALAAQERIIDYQHSVRWWVKLPWLRVRALWQRLRP